MLSCINYLKPNENPLTFDKTCDNENEYAIIRCLKNRIAVCNYRITIIHTHVMNQPRMRIHFNTYCTLTAKTINKTNNKVKWTQSQSMLAFVWAFVLIVAISNHLVGWLADWLAGWNDWHSTVIRQCIRIEIDVTPQQRDNNASYNHIIVNFKMRKRANFWWKLIIIWILNCTKFMHMLFVISLSFVVWVSVIQWCLIFYVENRKCK